MNRNHMNSQSNIDAARAKSITPTQMIRDFRKQVLNGICPLPYDEGGDDQLKEQHAEKLRQRAKSVGGHA